MEPHNTRDLSGADLYTSTHSLLWGSSFLAGMCPFNPTEASFPESTRNVTVVDTVTFADFLSGTMVSQIAVLQIAVLAVIALAGIAVGVEDKPIPCGGCFFNLDEVCGSDLRTYGNMCSLKCAIKRDKSRTLRLLHKGRCDGL
ncbi:hypothetical protein GE061_002413 [Apolygus lucorum]|uniref:Kazal-like domain-containing protein n=1 Tax=Apolygus lucorum TaxID=248454 RepID=A0A8S9X539_APOLU|nr:hypothetical protein GE061_002413 [Apolygus lucorum]